MIGQLDSGIVFHISNNVTPELRPILKSSARAWCNNTGIKWSISEDIIDSVNVANDSINLLVERPMTDFSVLHGQAAMIITGHFSNCGMDQTPYILDVDIMINSNEVNQFDDNFSWKWKNRLVHEFGHAHLLNHSRNPSIPTSQEYIMNAVSSNLGTGFHSIQPDDFTGANTIFASSAALLVNCGGISSIPIISSGNCNGIIIGVHTLSPEDFSLKVFPNPNATETLNISLDLEKGETIGYEIYDILGNLVIRDQGLQAKSGNNTIEVDLHGNIVSSGIYMLKLTIGKTIVTTKFVRI
jgi:hypothetical protein